jgi:hypothetical protein
MLVSGHNLVMSRVDFFTRDAQLKVELESLCRMQLDILTSVQALGWQAGELSQFEDRANRIVEVQEELESLATAWGIIAAPHWEARIQ